MEHKWGQTPLFLGKLMESDPIYAILGKLMESDPIYAIYAATCEGKTLTPQATLQCLVLRDP
jgi:hypothetical protein